MKFKRTYDREFIWRCLTQPHIWEATPNNPFTPELYFPQVTENIVWVQAGNSGVVALERVCDTVYELHIGLTRNARGKAAIIVKDLLKWFVSKYTHCEGIVTKVPEYNTPAARTAGKVGFQEIDRIVGAYDIDGKLGDMLVYRLDRSTICQF